MFPRWLQFVAFLLLAFTFMDVCMPESCADELPGSMSGPMLKQAVSNSNDSGGSTCAFEEDCIACANILPSTHFQSVSLTLVFTAEPDFCVSALDGSRFLPYHPPRS